MKKKGQVYQLQLYNVEGGCALQDIDKLTSQECQVLKLLLDEYTALF